MVLIWVFVGMNARGLYTIKRKLKIYRSLWNSAIFYKKLYLWRGKCIRFPIDGKLLKW